MIAAYQCLTFYRGGMYIVNISVCVGSSCHLRGSYNIIELMKSNLARYGLTDRVNLGAAFCLGKCTEGGFHPF